jgi:hypothetical protein
MGIRKLPRQILREAFRASGEKNYTLSKVFYASLFGSHWRYALLGFAYLKCLDNIVDEDLDTRRASATLAAQRDLLDQVYSDLAVEKERPIPERYGYYFLSYDKSNGSLLRPFIESVIETMEFDVQRRNQVVSKLTLEAYVLKLGEAVWQSLAHFVSSELRLPKSFTDQASCAYLYADFLIDLEHDLQFGIINIPVEDIRQYQIDLATADDRLSRWLTARSEEISQYFAQAFREAQQLSRLSMKLLSFLYLSRKRRNFRRFLKRKGIDYPR